MSWVKREAGRNGCDFCIKHGHCFCHDSCYQLDNYNTKQIAKTKLGDLW